jgi:integrase
LREERKLVGGSINTVMATIRKFYDINDIELRWKKIKMYVGKGKGNNKKDRPYSHQEIARMLEKADQRARIAILLMYSSGMRVGALPSLKIRNLQKIDKYNLYRITVYEGQDEEYITFCTPECTAAIDSYLEYRQRHGEHPLREDAPLIREEFDINDEIHANRPRELSVQSFRMMIKNTGHRSGVIEKHALSKGARPERRPVKETHGYRKAFQTTAITTGMNPLFSELLMGHKSGGLALESYVRPTEGDLLEGNDRMLGYISIISALTINEEHKLRRENIILKQRQENNDQMLIELQRKFDAMEKRLGYQ